MSLPRAAVPLLVLLLAAAPLPVLPQSGSSGSDTGDAASGAADNRIQYLVEVITFRYLGSDMSGGETFDQLYVEDYLPSDPFDIDEYNRVNGTVSYTNMSALAGALQQLQGSERYQVLSSNAWIQPLLGRDEAVDVPLGQDGGTSLGASSGEPVYSRLSGSMRVYGDYLLFVDIDLKIKLPARAEDTGYTTVIGGASTSEPLSDGIETFHLSERRRIKLEEIHYFDHPYFGAIVSVVRHGGGQSG